MPFDVERKSSGGVTRDKFEKALLDRMTESGAGWDRPIAMVAFSLMFISRSISDLAQSVDGLAITIRKGQR